MYLYAKDGLLLGKEFSLNDKNLPVEIGRGVLNTVVLLEGLVSKKHALVNKKGGNFIIKDLGSKNGVYLNGKCIDKEEVININDEIKIGSSTFLVNLKSINIGFEPAVLNNRKIPSYLKNKNERVVKHKNTKSFKFSDTCKNILDWIVMAK